MRDKADKRLWTLSIVGCVIVVLTVLFVSVKIETNNTKNRIHSTMEYIKDQYSMYNSFNEAVEARSLVRMVEKVQQTARNFKTDKQALEKEYLKQYAREQRLTGIIVLMIRINKLHNIILDQDLKKFWVMSWRKKHFVM